jgi:hypothetical protein
MMTVIIMCTGKAETVRHRNVLSAISIRKENTVVGTASASRSPAGNTARESTADAAAVSSMTGHGTGFSVAALTRKPTESLLEELELNAR